MTTPAARLARLTERQRACLRLLSQGLDVGLIAGELRISRHTVESHLKEARRVLEVGSSREAARALAVAEGDVTPQSSATSVSGIPDEPPFELHSPAEQEEIPRAGPEVNDVVRAFGLDQVDPVPLLPVWTRRFRSNQLPLRRRLLWIAAIALGSAMLVTNLLGLFKLLS